MRRNVNYYGDIIRYIGQKMYLEYICQQMNINLYILTRREARQLILGNKEIPKDLEERLLRYKDNAKKME